MATFYSSFFSSGLLAQPSPRAITPRPGSPTTPRAALSSLAPDDTTPTGPATVQDVFSSNESQTLPSISVAAPTPTTEGDSRPRLRRRRSSLAGAASPLTNMKSSVPIRQAAASVQRQNLALRSRAGSDASILSTATASSVSSFGAAGPENAPASNTQRPGIIGRLRSGSLGTALLRPRRGLRRAAPPMPAPPPTAPLPAVPPVPSSPSPSRTLPTIISEPTTPRRPLTRRAQTCDNYDLTSSPFSIAGASPMCVTDDEDAFAAACAGLPSSPGFALGKGVENDMQVDYPSPVDHATFDWRRKDH
ncbi:hypothetical protein C8Q70DRAFT_1047052 [Cubamyces menziesii]|nr:hypothetical protein C8Q70DRAFT_1047052 [Cubamyces menziesii]